MEKVIKGLHDARRYLEDKEWSDRGASPYIDAIKDALALIKEQEAEISFLKGMQLKTIHNMSEEDIGNAVAELLQLKGW